MIVPDIVQDYLWEVDLLVDVLKPLQLIARLT
jgi:hypothetical protein